MESIDRLSLHENSIFQNRLSAQSRVHGHVSLQCNSRRLEKFSSSEFRLWMPVDHGIAFANKAEAFSRQTDLPKKALSNRSLVQSWNFAPFEVLILIPFTFLQRQFKLSRFLPEHNRSRNFALLDLQSPKSKLPIGSSKKRFSKEKHLMSFSVSPTISFRRQSCLMRHKVQRPKLQS